MSRWFWPMAFASAMAVACVELAHAHDIYTGVHGKDGQLCCGEEDCFPTAYREEGGGFEFWLDQNDQKRWLKVPADRITFLPIPGDPPSNAEHHAHICYRSLSPGENTARFRPGMLVDGVVFWCAFIPPGGV